MGIDGSEAIGDGGGSKIGGKPRRVRVLKKGFALGEEVTRDDFLDVVFWPVKASSPYDTNSFAFSREKAPVVVAH